MLRVVKVLFGAVLLLIGLLLLVIAGWVATYTHHDVDSFEREHLEAAVQFVRQREQATGTFPDADEFHAWALAMDAKGRFRFDGHGYTIDRRCTTKASEFCISFWTGDDFVTYRSWQTSMKRVLLDESPYPLALAFLVAALVAGGAGTALIVRGRANASAMESYRADG
jgi:hypothetical protein